MSEIKIETSHNVEINVQAAPLSSRIFAYLIDMFIIGVYLFFFFIFFLAASSANRNGENSIYVIIIVVLAVLPVWLYHLLFEVFNHGQSWGKKIMKIKVVKVDGSQPTLGGFILRWLLRPIDNFFYGSVAIITIAVSKNNQRLGDLAGGTAVVKTTEKVTLRELTQYISKEEYFQVFKNVDLLSQGQIDVIKEAIYRYNISRNPVTIKELALKVKSKLNIVTEYSDYQFLYIIVKDFENMNQK